MVKDTRQGWALFAAMSIVFLAGVFVAYHGEQAGNPMLTKLGLESAATPRSRRQHGRQGSALRHRRRRRLFATVVTTDASCGAVNSMHDSFTPLGGLVPMVNISLAK
jgi:K+-transporting ATPase ATPase A chain